MLALIKTPIGANKEQELSSDLYLMNGLSVTLPLLLLLLPSLNASDPPILVLEQTASAVRARLHSQGANE